MINISIKVIYTYLCDILEKQLNKNNIKNYAIESNYLDNDISDLILYIKLDQYWEISLDNLNQLKINMHNPQIKISKHCIELTYKQSDCFNVEKYMSDLFIEKCWDCGCTSGYHHTSCPKSKYYKDQKRCTYCGELNGEHTYNCQTGLDLWNQSPCSSCGGTYGCKWGCLG